MKALIIALLALVTSTNAATASPNICFSTAKEVKNIYPGDSAKFTHYMKGHRKDKCWYAASLGFDHDKRGDTKPKPPVMAKATPTEVAVVRPEFREIVVKKFEDAVYQPMFLTPNELVAQDFDSVGWK